MDGKGSLCEPSAVTLFIHFYCSVCCLYAWRCDQPQLNGNVNRRVFPPCCWRHSGERVEGLPITNECVHFDAKFKSSTDCSSLSAILSAPLVHFRESAGGPEAGWGCARGTDWSSHKRARRLCEIIAKLGSPAQAKRDEIFVSPLVPHPPPSATNSSLSPIIGQSQSELKPQSHTRQIRLRSTAWFLSLSRRFIFC